MVEVKDPQDVIQSLNFIEKKWFKELFFKPSNNLKKTSLNSINPVFD